MWPFPQALSNVVPEWLLFVFKFMLYCPAVVVDFVTTAFYWALVMLKGAIVFSGPAWRPAQWGEFSEQYLGVLLQVMTDNLGFQVGLHLRGLVFMCAHTTCVQVATAAGAKLTYFPHSLANMASKMVFGGGSDAQADEVEEWHSVFGFSGALLPENVLTWFWLVNSPMVILSMAMNIYAILSLLKRAFGDCHPVPVEVLDAKQTQSPARKKARISKKDR